MRLKTLEMSGFKSFVDRTSIQFEEGITGVVGPNGCGKSNIVDAIRWVMGEMSAKHLRGSEMADVIFNGCESRPPVGMAQVFLTFDNSDGRAPADYAQYSEIQVGRRLYRSGESEYFINKTPCRLKDIVDLFLGTGVGSKAYSIVEQGMVGAIVSSKPEDRRILIEEAAGISKFKSRKEAALRKMESTKLNLERLNDIQGELTRQINSLNRQAKKAERYQKASDELQGRELALAATRHRVMRTELEVLSAEHQKLRESETTSSAGLSGFEAEIEAKRLSLAEGERELDGVQQDLYRAEHSIKLCEAEISHREKERERIVSQNAVLAGELESLKERSASVDRQIEEANSAMVAADLTLADSAEVTGALDLEVEGVRADFQKFQAEADGHKEKAMSCDAAIASLNSTIDSCERRHIDVAGRIARDQTSMDAIDRRSTEIKAGLAQHEQELSGSRQMKLKLEEESGAVLQALAEQRQLSADAEARFTALRNEAGDKRARQKSLKELRENLEGYRDGVRAVLSRSDADGQKLAGIMGTVGELIETDSEFEPALGAVLGDKLQYVVVKSHEEGVEAIDYLRSAACGRSSFIPLGVRTAEAGGEAPSGEGVVGPISNFVRFADDYRHICQYLLGDVVLVDDLRRALDLWGNKHSNHTFVTRDGCVVDPSGVVTGGSGAGVEGEFIAQKRKAKELEDELNRLGGELTSAEGEAKRLSERVKLLEEQAEGLRRDAHGRELFLVGQERDVLRVRDELKRYEGDRDRLAVETAALAEELAEAAGEREEAKQRLVSEIQSRDAARERLAALQGEIETLSEKKDKRERELIDLKVELAQARERAASVARELVGLVDAKTEAVLGVDRRFSDISQANGRMVILGREIEGFKSDLDLAIRRVSRLQETQALLKERYETESAALRDQELSIRDLRRCHAEALASFHEVELRLSEHRGRMQYLSDNIRERYHLDLSTIEAEHAKEDLDIEVEEQAVAELKERIDGIGPVNVDAIKEFEELSMRHEFMTKQTADLAASLENLSKAIARIDRTSRQRFRRAFEAVDAEFRTLFPKLFRGGQARLMLTDEENILETGIEIIAQPPGKKLQSITLLSGGEKALTAVALIFSIFLIKPSPFCLLDEVDAPLDDVNIDRFNDLIRSMTPHSQFILITHNKRTMELADLLYGVTMEEAGVSKMVSVRLGVDKEKEKESEPAVA
ncbi:MAG: chromosome segregation protein SMC [Pseudomonadota bacterium]